MIHLVRMVLAYKLMPTVLINYVPPPLAQPNITQKELPDLSNPFSDQEGRSFLYGLSALPLETDHGEMAVKTSRQLAAKFLRVKYQGMSETEL